MKQPSFPPRLSESSSDERLVDALDVARGYDPSSARVRRALARFDAERAAGTSPSRAPSVVGRGATTALKVGALAAVAITLAGGWSLVRSGADPSPPANAPASVSTSPVEPAPPAPTAAAPLEATSIRVDDLPTAPAPRPAPRAGGKLSFDDELGLVESARAALARGDASGCLAQLDEYDRRVQRGTFEREVAVMRIEASIARGDTTRARSLGEAFLAQSPDSPYANRIRSLLARVQPTSTP